MLNIDAIESPIDVDAHWESLTDSQKFSLWVAASGVYFDTEVPDSTKQFAIRRYREVLSWR